MLIDFSRHQDNLQKHLDRVSRSFAFCISRLENPLRSWVSLTYLICRILDTVEDAPWRAVEDQTQQYIMFDQLLLVPPENQRLMFWQSTFPQQISSGEKLLIEDSYLIFSGLHTLPERSRKIIQEMVLCMSAGMQHYSQMVQSKGQLQLHSLMEVNQYCFFVAGVVGEALARLVSQLEPQLMSVKDYILSAHHFGLFLQKINILKDQKEDEKVGRFFVPDRKILKESLVRDVHRAWHFFENIPLSQKGFRLFCAQSLYLGLASLPRSEKSYQENKSLKIPRLQTLQLFSVLERKINEPHFLKELFLKLLIKAELSPLEKNPPSCSDTHLSIIYEEKKHRFISLYHGLLKGTDFQQLGLIEGIVG